MFLAHEEPDVAAAVTTEGFTEAFPSPLPDGVGEAAFELFLSVCYNK